MKKWYYYLLYAVIAVAVASALWMGWQRHQREAANDTLALVVDYDQVVELAVREKMQDDSITVRDVLRQLADTGITGVLFKEQTLADSVSVHRDVWTATGNELLTNPVFAGDWAEIKPEYTYFLTRSQAEFKRIAERLETVVPVAQSLTEPASGVYLVGVPLSRGMVNTLPLGFSVAGLQLVEDMGLNAVVQIRSWPGAGAEDVQQVFDSFRQYPISAVLFNDKALPGQPQALAEEIAALGVPLAAVEFFPQQGFNTLANQPELSKNVVRLHAISAGEMVKTTPREAVDRFVLAATDRNNRILFTRFFMNDNNPQWLAANKQYLGDLISALDDEGFKLGQPKSFPPIINSRIILLLIGLGGIAGGVLLLNKAGYPRLAILAGLVLAAIYAAMLAAGYVSLARKLFALGGTIVFPTLAVISFTREAPRTVIQSVVATLATIGVSLLGAVLMVGLLADKSFLLKLDQFLGVKAAFVGPPALIFLYLAFFRLPRDQWLPRIKAVLDSNITVKYAALVGVLGLIGLVYVMRSGNEGIFVSDLELRLRNILEQVLVVRPRTKEFLIGHPLLLLSYYLGYRDYLLPVIALASIGQVSLVNTFAHTWTPVAISLLRTVNGVWLGILGGLALIALYRSWLWLEARYLRGE